MASSPPRVTEDIDIGRPECETVIDAMVATPDELVILGPGLIRNGIGNIEHQIFIPAVCNGYRLRKYSGITGTGNTVQGFVPPVIFRHPKSWNGRSSIKK